MNGPVGKSGVAQVISLYFWEGDKILTKFNEGLLWCRGLEEKSKLVGKFGVLGLKVSEMPPTRQESVGYSTVAFDYGELQNGSHVLHEH